MFLQVFIDFSAHAWVYLFAEPITANHSNTAYMSRLLYKAFVHAFMSYPKTHRSYPKTAYMSNPKTHKFTRLLYMHTNNH